MCWNRHYGVIISPTILWNIVLSNLAFEVNKNPETYRKYFTESDEKQEIIIEQDGNKISVLLLIDALRSKIPTEAFEEFFPAFTTDTEKSIKANYTAFLDMVSPYYNYGMLLCGIPKIKVLGTQEDWDLFMTKTEVISIQIPEFGNYLMKIRDKMIGIAENSTDYTDFFSLQKCGSGSQVVVSGWIRDFFIEQPRVPYPENFVSCISKIDYKNYNECGKEYRLYAGLFTSEIQDGYLVPAFDNIYFEKTNLK